MASSPKPSCLDNFEAVGINEDDIAHPGRYRGTPGELWQGALEPNGTNGEDIVVVSNSTFAEAQRLNIYI